MFAGVIFGDSNTMASLAKRASLSTWLIQMGSRDHPVLAESLMKNTVLAPLRGVRPELLQPCE